ncbi:hypothetical protein ABHI18_011850, partial [Aspergillus niger]
MAIRSGFGRRVTPLKPQSWVLELQSVPDLLAINTLVQLEKIITQLRRQHNPFPQKFCPQTASHFLLIFQDGSPDFLQWSLDSLSFTLQFPWLTFPNPHEAPI